MTRPPPDEAGDAGVSASGSAAAAEPSDESGAGVAEGHMLTVQCNLTNTYEHLGRLEEAMRLRREVYYGQLKLNGEEHQYTLREANNYSSLLHLLKQFEEAKSLLRKTMPVARRVLGECHDITIKMRWIYAEALYQDPGATLDGLGEAVTILEATERITRRVFGGAYPLTQGIEIDLRNARATLRAREAGESVVFVE